MIADLEGDTDHATLIHMALSSLLLRTSDEDELDVRDGRALTLRSLVVFWWKKA